MAGKDKPKKPLIPQRKAGAPGPKPEPKPRSKEDIGEGKSGTSV